MKKFKFRLENVLKVRAIHKKVAEREVSLTHARINKNQEEMQENEQALTDAYRLMAERDSAMPFWNDLTWRYQEGLERRREQLVEQHDELKERLAGDQAALTRRRKDEMVIEQLKEYKKQEHLAEALAEDQAQIEEIESA